MIKSLAPVNVIDNHAIQVPEDLVRIYKNFESRSVTIVKSLVSPGDVFVDVGANFGFYSVLASVLVGASGRVHAIEPSPQTFELLVANTKDYANVKVHPVAVGNSDSKASFFHSADYVNSGFAPDPFKDPLTLEQIEVRVQRLDSLLATDTGSPSVDFLKVDVQGDDVDVLMGAKKIIERNQTIKVLVEWAPAWMHNSGFDYLDLPNTLIDLGLKNIVAIDDWTNSTMTVSEFEAEIRSDNTGKRFCNLLAQK